MHEALKRLHELVEIYQTRDLICDEYMEYAYLSHDVSEQEYSLNYSVEHGSDSSFFGDTLANDKLICFNIINVFCLTIRH